MAPWVLFSYAQSLPQSRRRVRIAWGIGILLFSGTVFAFCAVGAVGQWIAWELPDAIFTTLLAIGMAGAAAAAIFGFVQIARERRVERQQRG
ncbi:hypothetical protein [Microbacterium sp. HJ5]